MDDIPIVSRVSKRELRIWIAVFAVGILIGALLMIVGFLSDNNPTIAIASIIFGGLGFSAGVRVLWLGARPPREPTEGE